MLQTKARHTTKVQHLPLTWLKIFTAYTKELLFRICRKGFQRTKYLVEKTRSHKMSHFEGHQPNYIWHNKRINGRKQDFYPVPVDAALSLTQAGENISLSPFPKVLRQHHIWRHPLLKHETINLEPWVIHLVRVHHYPIPGKEFQYEKQTWDHRRLRNAV